MKLFASEEELKEIIARLGAQITADYEGKYPIFVGVLRGCFIFMADLVRACNVPCTIDFMVVSSYGAGTTSTGAVKIVKDLTENINSIRIVTLLDKPERRTADVKADYVGFVIPDAFVVGYGLDYNERYRNLPYIGVLKPEIYS